LGTGEGRADVQRVAAKELWAKIAEEFKWDGAGEERLCAVCATRRFLIPPWRTERPDINGPKASDSFHNVWMEHGDYSDGRLRMPMPSTAAIAAAPYLARLYGQATSRGARDQVATEARSLDWPPTFFARSLQAVGGSMSDDQEPFGKLEPSILFDEPRRAELVAREARTGRPTDAAANERLREAVSRLPGIDGLSSRFAVVAVDGDRLGRLLLGEADAVGATWSDTLHPRAVERIGGVDEEWAAEWRQLLHERRLMGPTLHAFINRAVTTFANRVVPWVVEREFAGRLVYAGGDDILALAPAADALGIAARLHQLWSAPWVLDTEPKAHAWTKGRWDPAVAQLRFRVPVVPPSGELTPGTRSEERRVGKECRRLCRSRWSPYH
jgi:CRISPR-associated protein Cmr2